MGQLAGQTALVTGGGRGIGEAIARRLAGEGARVVLASRTRADLDRVAREIGAAAEVCDVSVPEQVESLARAAGRVDVLVNNAGIAESAPLVKTDLESWRRIVDTNVTGAFLLCRAVVPWMIARKYGRIVNVASMAGKHGIAYASAYAASKHALLGLTRSLALELERSGILVNAVCPGYVDTDMTRNGVERVAKLTGRPAAEIRQAFLATAGQAVMITADAVADVALPLALPGCAQTGQAIDV
jgi:NAD(P)-dependent dehydrogenase (short-subunit alcohol dehydrogenase family)